MQPCLCKKHLREVANVYDKETAFAFQLDEANCLICNKVVFIEGARRYVTTVQQNNAADQTLRLPNSFVHSGS